MSICGNDYAQSSGSFDAVMEQFHSMIENFRESCKESVGATLMEGTVGDPELPELTPMPPPPEAGEVEGGQTEEGEPVDNGNGTSTQNTTNNNPNTNPNTQTSTTTDNQTGKPITK